MITAQPKQLPQIFLLILFLVGIAGHAQYQQPNPQYRIISGENFVQAKNYYLLTLLQESPELKKIIGGDSVLRAVAKSKTDSLQVALKTCGKEGLCYINALKFSEAEIELVGRRLKDLCQPGNALGKLVKEHIIPSGTYILFQSFPAAEILQKAWVQDATGINFALDVYAAGKKPNYPNINSISFATRDPKNNAVFLNGYISLLYNTASLVAAENKTGSVFFSIPLTAASLFIEINEREQAADYEPMVKGENKLAYDRVKSIDWKQYKYSVIMIPGAGPEEPTVALSAEGMLRCRQAAIQYKNGAAPFIVTSGGKVHPYKTKYCEAIEMKKYLVEKLHIPANAVLIDPHARHTTTNMRNTVRLIYRYGMPFTKPALTCTTRGQSNMIETTLISRCIRELQEAPYKNGLRLSETAMEFYPLIEALHINPSEPMDP